MAVHGDSLPLETLDPVARQIVVSLYSLWGLEHLTICLISLMVLIRYRSMIPFMFLILIFFQEEWLPVAAWKDRCDDGLISIVRFRDGKYLLL